MLHQKSKSKEWFILTCFLLLGSLLIFARFVFGTELFVYFADANDDTFQSYLPLYQMMATKLRDGDFSLMELSWGMGTNILSAQNFLFDPFNLPLYLLGDLTSPLYVAFGLVFCQIFRILCAGWACRWFLAGYDLTPSARIIASLAFAFSAFTIGGIGQHYYFASTLSVGVFYLAVIDRSFTHKKYLLWTALLTALLCIFSVYLAYMVLLTAGIYALVRCVFDGTPQTVAKFLHTLLPLLAAVLIGILLSAFVFIPTAYLMSGSSRFSEDRDWFTLFLPSSLSYFKTTFLRFFSETMEGSVNSWDGYKTAFNSPHIYMSGFLIACIPQHFASLRSEPRHIRRGIYTAYLLCFISFSTLLVGTLYNVFVEYTPRFIFMLMPLGAYCIAKTISNAQRRSFFSRTGAIITGILCLLAFLLSFESTASAEVPHMVASFSPLAALLFLGISAKGISQPKFRWKSALKIGSLTLVGVAVVIEGWTSLYVGRDTVAKDWYVSTYEDLASQTIRQLKEESGNNFFRVEYSYHGWIDRSAFGNSMAQNYYSVSAYNSVLPKPYQNFRRYFCAPYQDYTSMNSCYGLGFMGRPLDKTLADLYGLRYILCFYPTTEPGWTQSGPYTNENGSTFWMLENPDIETMGITYYAWYPEDSLAQLSVLERQTALSHAVSLDKAAVQVPETDAAADCTTVALDVDSLAFTPENEFEQGMEISLESVASAIPSGEDCRLWLVFDAKTTDDAALNAAVDTGESYSMYDWQNGLWQLAPEDGWQEYVLPLSTTASSVLFYQTGSASADEQTSPEENSTVIELRNLRLVTTTEHAYTTTNSTMSCTKNSSLVSGTVNMDKAGIFVLPVTYDSGWSVIVDGSTATLLSADASFLAVELPEGSHQVEFRYTTPGLRIGAGISVLGIVLFLLFMLSLYFESFPFYRKK